jgi:hypothetical protein
MPKLEPWRVRCTYVSPKGTSCQTVTPRSWEFCVTHSANLGEDLDGSVGSVTRTLEMPELRKPIGDLTSAEWHAVRLRLTRQSASVVL